VLNSHSINEMLKLLKVPNSQILHEKNLVSIFRELSSQERDILFQPYLDKDVIVHENSSTYETKIFPKISRQFITMMCSLLGYGHDKTINEAILGFMSSIFPSSLKPLVKFNYDQYLIDIIHFQLIEFEAITYFRYQSYLVHPFFSFQAIKLQHLRLKI
jgi:hypothetical protein